MSEDFEKRMLAGVAYRMFFEELQKHLLATEGLFNSTDWTLEQLKEASGRFHTIRGGSGFFKLSELGTLAGELEKALLSGSPVELAARIETLQDLDRKIRAVAQEIPRPVESA